MADVLGAIYGTNNVQIGDYAYVNTGDQVNVVVENIPRAKGSILKWMGGGLQTLTVNAWVFHSSRIRRPVNEYLRDLTSSLLDESPGTLSVNGASFSSSYFAGLSEADTGGHHWARFTVTFLRSSTA